MQIDPTAPNPDPKATDELGNPLHPNPVPKWAQTNPKAITNTKYGVGSGGGNSPEPGVDQV